MTERICEQCGLPISDPGAPASTGENVPIEEPDGGATHPECAARETSG